MCAQDASAVSKINYNGYYIDYEICSCKYQPIPYSRSYSTVVLSIRIKGYSENLLKMTMYEFFLWHVNACIFLCLIIWHMNFSLGKKTMSHPQLRNKKSNVGCDLFSSNFYICAILTIPGCTRLHLVAMVTKVYPHVSYLDTDPTLFHILYLPKCCFQGTSLVNGQSG